MNPNSHSIHIHIHFYSQYSMNYIPYLKPRKVHSLTMMKFEGCNPRRQELNGGILTFPLVTSTNCRWLAIFGRISFATGGNGDGREGACSTHFMANSGGTKKLRAGVLHQKVSKTGWRTIHIKGVGFFWCYTLFRYDRVDRLQKSSWGTGSKTDSYAANLPGTIKVHGGGNEQDSGKI